MNRSSARRDKDRGRWMNGWMDGRRGNLRKEMLDREAGIGCDSRGRRPRGSDGEGKSKQMEDI